MQNILKLIFVPAPSILLLGVIALCDPAVAQLRPSSSDAGLGNLPAQKIGPNDLISLSVYDAPELTRTIRVSADGQIRLPMLKRLIPVEGLFPSAVEAAIGAALQGEQLMVDPIVTVNIVEYHSHTVSVAGAVKSPVTFQAVSPVTLLEAITRAGGLAQDAGLEILVTRTRKVPGNQSTVLTQRIPVRALIEAADPELNVTLTGGEEVRVPEIGKIFVVGSVKKSGAFPVQDSSETTVLQMLALAEGLSGITGKEAFIYRREGNGAKNEIPIQLKAIMDRKSPDVPLIANDILYIPENKNRKLSLAIIEKTLLFGTTAGATALTYGLIR